MKRAFTLIELLVVIAIIAILAAILFPVFAQAREKAREITCVSNAKELGTSMMMYTQDFDELYPLAVTWGNPWSDWSDTIQPYMKSWDIMYCPSGGPRMIASWSQPQYEWWANWRWFVQYGFNADYLNNANGQCTNFALNGEAFGPPTALAAVQEPARTICLAEDGQDAPDDGVGTSLAYSPASQTAPDDCSWGGWGTNGGLWYPAGSGTTTMGFFKPRHNLMGTVLMCDGHAKVYTPGQLAAGTNWQPGLSDSSVIITDESQYLWSLNK